MLLCYAILFRANPEEGTRGLGGIFLRQMKEEVKIVQPLINQQDDMIGRENINKSAPRDVGWSLAANIRIEGQGNE